MKPYILVLSMLFGLAAPAPATPPAPSADKADATPEMPAPVAIIGEKDAKLNCTWVQAGSTVPVSGNESRDQARARAIEQSLDAAMRDLLGVDVNQRSLDFQQESLRGQTNLIENVLRTTRRGCIVNQKIISDEYRDLGACRQCGYYVGLNACIKERPSDWDKDFNVELHLSRDNFMEGDEAKISITARREAYIYVYDVQMNSETSLIVPNEYISDNQVKADQAWVYPSDEETAKHGLHLWAQLPNDKPPLSAETIRVVATKTPLPAKIFNPAKGGYLGVLQRLNTSGQEWAEDAAAFTISPAKKK